MRLINTKTGDFIPVEDPRTVHYAVLSHVWSRKDSPDYVPEQTYQDVCRILSDRKNTIDPSTLGEPPSSGANSIPVAVESTPPVTVADSLPPLLCDKIRRFCEIAAEDGFELAWADTCCIDKTNPSELEEAIASMYDWYSYAKACYVFLPDVSLPDAPDSTSRQAGTDGRWEAEFRDSHWFRRGWTLQELLAPNVVIFFSKEWRVLGSKHTLTPIIQDITAIEPAILRCQKPLDAVSVAHRMSWAAGRQTTREEDRAYSMLGIFGVNIPIIYGEGSYAFYRLQEAIINEIPDQTIFAWHLCPPQPSLLPETFSRPSDAHRRMAAAPSTMDKELPKLPVNALYHLRQYLLANSPDDFANSSDLVPLSPQELVEILYTTPADAIQAFKSTAYGISTRLPLVQFTQPSSPSDSAAYLAVLACKFGGSKSLVALLLRPNDISSSVQASQYIVGMVLGPDSEVPPTPSDLLSSPPSLDSSYVRATVLTPEQAASFRDTFAYVDVFIANRPSRAQHKREHDLPLYRDMASIGERFQVAACGWSSRLLKQQGYTTSTRDSFNGAIQLKDGTLEDVAIHFVITRDSGSQGQHLEVQIGRLCTTDAKGVKVAEGLGVAVLCGSGMELADGYSGATREHHSHTSSWSRQGGAATKELYLVSQRRTKRILRLVLTHKSSDASRGAAESTGRSYRLGAEIFNVLTDTSQEAANSQQSRGSNRASTVHPTQRATREAHHAPRLTREPHPWPTAANAGTLPTSSQDRGMSGPRR